MIVRCQTTRGPTYAQVEDGRAYRIDDPFARPRRLHEVLGSVDELSLLAPCEPTNVIAAAGNLREWYAEADPLPEQPSFFLKSPACVVPPGADVFWPEASGAVAPEGEIAVVIGKSGRHIERTGARDYVLGITCANDVTALDLLERDLFVGKNFETFLPLGPGIVELGAEPISFSCTVDGTVVQSSSTQQFVFGIDELIEAASRVITLGPGDLILCGCPPKVEPPARPSTMTVEVEGVGTLVNRLV